MKGDKVQYKVTLDFGPFVRGIESLKDTFRKMTFLVLKREYISTSYAPELGVGLDV